MITLGINFYLSDNPQRMDELMQCFQYNYSNPAIDSIIVMLDRKSYDYLADLKYTESDKCVWSIGGLLGSRPTYKDMFQVVDMYAKTEVRAIANSDIFFPVSSMHHYDQLKEGQVWALSRWDELPHKERKHYNHLDSQDTWVWRGDMNLTVPADFTLGLPGCDNRIAKVLLDSGYQVLNPSLTVQTVHVHNTGHRTYDRSQTVPPPYYLVKPTSLK